MAKSAAANWSARWARSGRPDPLIGSAVPDRANNPKRKFTYSDTYRSGSLSIDRDADSGISEYDMEKLDNILRQKPKKAGK
jgi:hypothetical protein